MGATKMIFFFPFFLNYYLKENEYNTHNTMQQGMSNTDYLQLMMIPGSVVERPLDHQWILVATIDSLNKRAF